MHSLACLYVNQAVNFTMNENDDDADDAEQGLCNGREARWEGLAENGGFKPGMKKLLADGKLIIISMTVSSINGRIRFYS